MLPTIHESFHEDDDVLFTIEDNVRRFRENELLLKRKNTEISALRDRLLKYDAGLEEEVKKRMVLEAIMRRFGVNDIRTATPSSHELLPDHTQPLWIRLPPAANSGKTISVIPYIVLSYQGTPDLNQMCHSSGMIEDVINRITEDDVQQRWATHTADLTKRFAASRRKAARDGEELPTEPHSYTMQQAFVDVIVKRIKDRCKVYKYELTHATSDPPPDAHVIEGSSDLTILFKAWLSSSNVRKTLKEERKRECKPILSEITSLKARLTPLCESTRHVPIFDSVTGRTETYHVERVSAKSRSHRMSEHYVRELLVQFVSSHSLESMFKNRAALAASIFTYIVSESSKKEHTLTTQIRHPSSSHKKSRVATMVEL